MSLGWGGVIAACGLALAACGPPRAAAGFRSPTHDYPPPPRTTADGEVLGADRKPIADTLGGSRPPPAEQRER
jgi:hypothetical protein